MEKIIQRFRNFESYSKEEQKKNLSIYYRDCVDAKKLNKAKTDVNTYLKIVLNFEN
jgi:hypothetical protein